MKIAFISYEYPPDTAFGGIATYVEQAVQMLVSRGHDVEVFCGSLQREITETSDRLVVHRLCVRDRDEFAIKVAPRFAARHQVIGFDVLEAPEIGALARFALQLVPEIPLVLKLHTPSFVVGQMNFVPPTIWQKTRWYLGAIRAGKRPRPYPSNTYRPEYELEKNHALEADEIAAPSQAIADLVIHHWKLNATQLSIVPLPYTPVPALLDIAIETYNQTVTFIGRLETRKGVLDLANAIPLVLRQRPQTRFRFVGANHPSPRSNLDMQQFLEKKLGAYATAVEFTGYLALDQIPTVLRDTDLCVFPSLWESFGCVCVEAMAAGRGIVASRAGGMAELLDQGKVGKLVAPKDPQGLATAILELLSNPDYRMQLGRMARERLLTEYNQNRIGELQEASYERAIWRRRSLGSRDIALLKAEVA
jgi:glycogen synthase